MVRNLKPNLLLQSLVNTNRGTLAEMIAEKEGTLPSNSQITSFITSLSTNINNPFFTSTQIQALLQVFTNTFLFFIPYNTLNTNNGFFLYTRLQGIISHYQIDLLRWFEVTEQLKQLLSLLESKQTFLQNLTNKEDKDKNLNRDEKTNTNRTIDSTYSNTNTQQGYSGDSFNPVNTNNQTQTTIQSINAENDNQLNYNNLRSLNLASSQGLINGKSDNDENLNKNLDLTENETETLSKQETINNFDMSKINELQLDSKLFLEPFLKKCAELFEFIDLDTDYSYEGGFNIG